MTMDAMPLEPPIEIFKALSDPVRWSIIVQMASVEELACAALEDTLPISKPTISYHTKILHHAGLIKARKSGRNYYYSLRRDVLRTLLDDLSTLASTPGPMVRKADGDAAAGRQGKRAGAPGSVRERHVAREDVADAVVPTR